MAKLPSYGNPFNYVLLRPSITLLSHWTIIKVIDSLLGSRLRSILIFESPL